MDDLLRKYNDFLTLMNLEVCYDLENGMSVQFYFKKENFPHLIGLHKLIDIPVIQRFNDPNNKMVNSRYVNKKITKGNLTYSVISNSSHYPKIQDRYTLFDSERIKQISYTDIIIDFDKSLLPGTKLIKTKFLLYEQTNGQYSHLSLGIDNNNSSIYPETFFIDNSSDYIKGQNTVKVKKVTIINIKDKTVFFSDTF
ncbi:MAG TPA: PBECR4 domain-containing protein [Anaerovoracaceae bacterium]|nr:PBECR4 domain-containing protein [Anaerovoracaceae bacterium]